MRSSLRRLCGGVCVSDMYSDCLHAALTWVEPDNEILAPDLDEVHASPLASLRGVDQRTILDKLGAGELGGRTRGGRGQLLGRLLASFALLSVLVDSRFSSAMRAFINSRRCGCC